MLVLFGADLAERLADILLELRDVLDPLHDQMLGCAADTGLNRTQTAIGFVGLANYRCAEFGIASSFRSSPLWCRWSTSRHAGLAS